MKSPRLLLSVLSLTVGCALLPAQTATPAAPAAKVIPVSRVAWVNSNAFAAEEGGIKQLVRNIKQLELEFSGTESELNLQSEKLRTLVGELQKLQAGGEANAVAIQEKQAEGMKMQRELQAKQQQAQQAFGKAQQEKQGPVFAEIGKALTAFAKERELNYVLDVAKLGDAVLVAQPELDVTQDFIAYFNASHP
jgi:Skp family chaperone for outer membrane proteins